MKTHKVLFFANTRGVQISIRVSCLEIYQERILDLLAASQTHESIARVAHATATASQQVQATDDVVLCHLLESTRKLHLAHCWVYWLTASSCHTGCTSAHMG